MPPETTQPNPTSTPEPTLAPLPPAPDLPPAPPAPDPGFGPTPMSGPGMQPMPPMPPRKSKTGLIVGLSIAGVVLIAGVAALILLMHKKDSTSSSSSSSSQSTGSSKLGAKYTDTTSGITVAPPAGWEKQPTPDSGSTTTFANPHRDTVGSHTFQARLSMDNTDDFGKTLDEYVQSELIDQYKAAFDSFKVNSNKKITLNGQQTAVLDFNATTQGIEVRLIQTIAVKNGKVYTLIYGAAADKWSSYQAAIDASLQTVVLK